MPSFARLTLAESDLTTVYEGDAVREKMKVSEVVSLKCIAVDCLQNLHRSARTRTYQLIATEIPALLDRLGAIRAQAQEPSSALWPGHRDAEAFAPAKLEPSCQAKETKGLTQVVVGAATPNDDDDDAEEDDAETAVGAVGSRHAPVWQGHLAPNAVCQGAIELLLHMCPPISLLCADLEAWLLLEVPKIEDGNSFGTEIQEHMLKEIRDLGQLATKLMLLAQRHHTDRAELAMKWCRYPGLNDFAVSWSWQTVAGRLH